MKEELKCEHEYESMGGVTRDLYTGTDTNGQILSNREKYGQSVVFAVYCKKCGDIKEKKL